MENETIDAITTSLIGKDSAKLDAFLFNFLGRLGFVVGEAARHKVNLAPQEIVDMAKRAKEAVGL